MIAERLRLLETRERAVPWKKWGPYLSERQWGTVREDYSASGRAWETCTHDQARSYAFRWGEEGLAGFSDDKQHFCVALGLWNGKDPILKERLFGLAENEGNHGEDVKEIYYYLDATPTHSYLKLLYKYPQREFPYDWLVAENGRRGKTDPEFELMDTGILDDDRYWDVTVEYAKFDADDFAMRITAVNRGPESATLHVLPHFWFRNDREWGTQYPRPTLRAEDDHTIRMNHAELGEYFLYCEGGPELLFCDNETNLRRLNGLDSGSPFPKDAINDYLIGGRREAVNPEQIGTKAAANYQMMVPSHEAFTVHVRLSPRRITEPLAGFGPLFTRRSSEADEFYDQMQEKIADPDARRVQRQALAGLIWSKQFYRYDVTKWLNGDPGQPPPPPERKQGRNKDWVHLDASDVISMPDKWEYPWFAAWDLAFHCISLSLVDSDFAKEQLLLLTREWYLHPNGQLPACEWAFSEVNPPVHAWATWRVYQLDKKRNQGRGDLAFLERVYHKLLLNFTWWVNRKDVEGLNIFQGGFLGLDNIGVFDRNVSLSPDTRLEQCDATSWMAMYCLNMMRIGLELATVNPAYQDMATKFFEHFLRVAAAMANLGGTGVNLWNEEDEFFYDVLHTPGHSTVPLKVRSIVGLIPLFAVETLEPQFLDSTPDFKERVEWLFANRPEMSSLVSRWSATGAGERRLLSLLRGHRLKCLLRRALDETEFLSDYGIRSLSKYHDDHPYQYHENGQSFEVRYQPGDSDSNLFGGNSNWRGPVWFPINYLIIESLQKFHHYYGPDFQVECPTGSGQYLSLLEVSEELTRRLSRIFLRDGDGRRAVFGAADKVQHDPHFRDHVIFYECFHGDDGHGVGASHQTGWTALIAKLLQPREDRSSAQNVRRDTRDRVGERH
jgi:hypothetical protein